MTFRVLAVLVSTGFLLAETTALERAWQLAANGQLEQAISLLKQEVERNPRDADVRLLLGSLLSEGGQRDQAFLQLKEAVRWRPQSAEAHNALGEAYSNFGYSKDALESFQKAVQIDPQLGVARLNLGRLLLARGVSGQSELATTAAHLDRAIATLKPGPDAATAHYLRAKVFTQQADAKQAAAQLQKALAVRSDFPEAWSDLGEARKTLLDDPGATAAFERAIKLNPADAVAQYRLGEEYLKQNRPHLAVVNLQEADRLAPNDQSTLNALHRALRQAGQPEEAGKVKLRLAALLQARSDLSRDELAATGANNEGAQLQKNGDLPGALQRYRAALSLNPASVPIRVNLAVALLRVGQWTEGLDELHNALLRDISNPKIRAALMDAVAQAPPGTVPHWKEEPIELTAR